MNNWLMKRCYLKMSCKCGKINLISTCWRKHQILQLMAIIRKWGNGQTVSAIDSIRPRHMSSMMLILKMRAMKNSSKMN